MTRLQGKVAFITGAGRGIGRGIALAFAREGAALGLLEIDGRTLAETAKLLEAQGAKCLAIEGDVATRATCEAAIARTLETFGGLDVLVNNAAWTPTPGLLLADFDDATFARVLETNLWATFWCMQAARPHLVRRGKGSIINFASGSGTRGQETQGAYAAAKEGIRGLSRVAAREWGPEGIRVNVICPFASSPGMVDWSKLDPAGYATAIQQIPLRRVGDCEEDVGRVAVFLASDDSAYVTAQTMFVDGGSGTTR